MRTGKCFYLINFTPTNGYLAPVDEVPHVRMEPHKKVGQEVFRRYRWMFGLVSDSMTAAYVCDYLWEFRL